MFSLNYYDSRAEKLRNEQLQPFRKFLLRTFILQSTWFDITNFPKNVMNICIDYCFDIDGFPFSEWFLTVQEAMIKGLYCGKTFLISDPFRPECDQTYLEIPIEYLIIHYFMSSKIGVYPGIYPGANDDEYVDAVREIRNEFSNVDLRYRQNLIESGVVEFANYTREVLRIPDHNDWYTVVAEDVEAISELPVNTEWCMAGNEKYFKIEWQYLSVHRKYSDFVNFVLSNIKNLSNYRHRFVNRDFSERQFGSGESNLAIKKDEKESKKESKKGERKEKKSEKKVKKFSYIEDSSSKNQPRNKQELRKLLGRKGAKDVDRVWKKIQLGKKI